MVDIIDVLMICSFERNWPVGKVWFEICHSSDRFPATQFDPVLVRALLRKYVRKAARMDWYRFYSLATVEPPWENLGLYSRGQIKCYMSCILFSYFCIHFLSPNPKYFWLFFYHFLARLLFHKYSCWHKKYHLLSNNLWNVLYD